MKVLELFAGSRSFGKAAESLGFEVFSSDVNSFENIDYAVLILIKSLFFQILFGQVHLVLIFLLQVLEHIGIKTTLQSQKML